MKDKQAAERETLDKQVAQWIRERDRLNEMIAAAGGNVSPDISARHFDEREALANEIALVITDPDSALSGGAKRALRYVREMLAQPAAVTGLGNGSPDYEQGYADGRRDARYAMLSESFRKPAADAGQAVAWIAEHADDSKDFVNFYEHEARKQAAESGGQVRPLTYADAAPSVAQPALTEQDVDAIMVMVQEFASTWSCVGGRFDDGSAMERAEECKAGVREMIASAIASRLGRAGGEDAWIPVSERLPGNGDPLWLVTRTGLVVAGTKEWKQGWNPDYWTSENGDLSMDAVTHWMPRLPPHAPDIASETGKEN